MIPQPSSHGCYVCGTRNPWGLGMRYYTVAPYTVEARTRLGARYQGHPGWVHGGILAALLDEAMGKALSSQFPERFMVTARFELRYLAPVPIDIELTIRARITDDKRYLASAVCHAELPGGRIAVEGQGLLARPASTHPSGRGAEPRPARLEEQEGSAPSFGRLRG
jgi:acyl-coenzyme A thioesterase PaaI-like protein